MEALLLVSNGIPRSMLKTRTASLLYGSEAIQERNYHGGGVPVSRRKVPEEEAGGPNKEGVGGHRGNSSPAMRRITQRR